MWLCDSALFKRSDGISSVSSYTAKINQQIFQLKNVGEVIPNSVNVSRQVKRDNVNELQVFFSGALIEKKGICSLLKAWNSVQKTLPNAKLLIYGKGKTAPLKKLLSATALRTVEFSGHVSRDKVFSALSESALAVFPSYSETFGIMCIEAMAMHCPVIYTKRSCGPEIVIDGETGALVDPDNIEEIANTILKLLTNKELANSYAMNGHARALKLYDTTEVVKYHLAFYEKQINAFKLVHSTV
jgi:glycosyltransferase involved in cell wall biosynthesis